MADPFATPDDVAARWRPLTDAEEIIAETLCADASRIIRARFPGIDAQVTSGAVDAEVLTQVVAGMVKRALIAPEDGVSQQSQGDGPFTLAQTFSNPMRNVFLTAADEVLILGYFPPGSSHRFTNTTRHRENCGPVYIYGPGW